MCWWDVRAGSPTAKVRANGMVWQSACGTTMPKSKSTSSSRPGSEVVLAKWFVLAWTAEGSGSSTSTRDQPSPASRRNLRPPPVPILCNPFEILTKKTKAPSGGPAGLSVSQTGRRFAQVLLGSPWWRKFATCSGGLHPIFGCCLMSLLELLNLTRSSLSIHACRSRHSLSYVHPWKFDANFPTTLIDLFLGDSEPSPKSP